MERNSTSPRGTPALTWFQDVPVAALLDITNNKTVGHCTALHCISMH